MVRLQSRLQLLHAAADFRRAPSRNHGWISTRRRGSYDLRPLRSRVETTPAGTAQGPLHRREYAPRSGGPAQSRIRTTLYDPGKLPPIPSLASRDRLVRSRPRDPESNPHSFESLYDATERDKRPLLCLRGLESCESRTQCRLSVSEYLEARGFGRSPFQYNGPRPLCRPRRRRRGGPKGGVSQELSFLHHL